MALRDLVFRIQADDKASRTLGRVSGSVKNLTRSLGPLLGIAAAGGGAGLAILGLAKAISSVVEAGAEFEKTMKGVQAVTQETGRAFEELSAVARELGKSTVFTAVQAAQAMEKLGQAGFSASEILSVMPDVLNLAAAGMLEMSEAASVTSDLVRSMGVSLADFGEATDVMAKTAISAKTTISQLGFSFQDAAPVARQLGLNVKDLHVLLGILANRGFVATRAGTALRRIFAVLLGDIEKGEKGLANFGLTVIDAKTGFVGFADLIDQMRKAGVTATEILDAFGLRGGPAFLQIFDEGATAIRDWRAALNEAGVASEVARTRLDNFKGDMLLLISAMTEIKIVIFNALAPALREMAQIATQLARSWATLLERADIFRGITRLVNILKVAFVLLAGLAMPLMIRGIDALLFRLVALSLGFKKVWVEMIRTQTAFNIFTSSALPNTLRLGILGVASAVGFLAFQVTRAFLEMTGLDDVIQRFIIRFAGLGVPASQAFSIVASSARLLETRIDSLAERGLFPTLSDETNAARAQISALDAEMKAFFDEVLKRGGKVKVFSGGAFEQTLTFSPGSIEKAQAAVDAKFGEIRARLIIEGEGIAKLEQDFLKFEKSLEELLSKRSTELFEQFGLRGGAEAFKDFKNVVIQAFNEAGGVGKRFFDLVDKLEAERIDKFSKNFFREKELREAQEKAVKRLTTRLKELGLSTPDLSEKLGKTLAEAQVAAKSLGTETEDTFELIFTAYRKEIEAAVKASEELGFELSDLVKPFAEKLRVTVLFEKSDENTKEITSDIRNTLQALFVDVGISLETSLTPRLDDVRQLFERIASEPLDAEIIKATEQLRQLGVTLLEELVPGFELVDQSVSSVRQQLATLNAIGLEAFIEQVAQLNAEWVNTNVQILRAEEAIQRMAQIGMKEFNAEVSEGMVEWEQFGDALQRTLIEQIIPTIDLMANAIANAFIEGEVSFRDFIKTVLKGLIAAIVKMLLLIALEKIFSANPVAGFAVSVGVGIGQGLGNAVGGGSRPRQAHGGILRGGLSGIDSVPFVGQQGEAVLPRNLTSFLLRAANQQGSERTKQGGGVIPPGVLQQGGAGAGGDTFNVTLQAVDGQSLRVLLENQPEALAAGIRTATKRGAL